MYITYHGTGAAEGVPAIFCDCEFCRYARSAGGKEIRMRSGALIDGALKLDFGPDAYAQMLIHRATYVPVNHVLITHSHPDHFSPVDLSRITPPYSHREKPLIVHGNRRVCEMLASEPAGRELIFEEARPFESFDADGYWVTPLKAVHAQGEEPLIYLIEKDEKRLLYAHDTGPLPEEDWAFLEGKRMDLISLDCTNGVLEGTKYRGHMGIGDNLRMRELFLEKGIADENTRFVANHFSHNGLAPYEEMEKRLPGFTVAWDGMTLRV